MQRVTGIGGIFFKAKDPTALREWYARHLGLDIQDWGGMVFPWHHPAEGQREGSTVWCIFPADSDYYPGGFMVNYRVPDLVQILALLKSEGCAVDEKTESSEFGKFGWVTDPEGNRIELWEPPAE